VTLGASCGLISDGCAEGSVRLRTNEGARTLSARFSKTTAPRDRKTARRNQTKTESTNRITGRF
jgi:hypothetical protein